MKNNRIENPNREHMVTCFMNNEEFFFQKNTKISIFRPNSKSLKLFIFGLERGSENNWIR
jgi:hypothetical protein